MPLHTRVLNRLDQVSAVTWKQLDTEDNPFLSYALLTSLEQSGVVSPENGWRPQHIAAYHGEQLVGLLPCYEKTHSYGEFVFDWQWANAYTQHGLGYYPKLLSAVPFSPVSGRRFLLDRRYPVPEDIQQALFEHVIQHCEQQGYSSWHCNFLTAAENAALEDTNLIGRCDWQFHWRNAGYADFADFLTKLRNKRRKNIRRERRSIQQAGITIKWHSGKDIEDKVLEFAFRCYQHTFIEKMNPPPLNWGFFRSLRDELGDQLLIVLAYKDQQAIAATVFLFNSSHLYGRYWGALQTVANLHFELAYYQGIEFCLKHNLQVFEPGAQGEHKYMRGFEPVKTYSRHYIQRPDFRHAVREYCTAEAQYLDDYRQQLAQHPCYRSEHNER